MRWERPDCGPEVQWNLSIEDTTGNHLYICVHPAQTSVPNSELDQIHLLRTADSILNGEVYSIHFKFPSQIALHSDSYCDSDFFTGHTVCTHHCPTQPCLACQPICYQSLQVADHASITGVHKHTHTQCQLGGVRERSYGEEQEFSPTDICSLVRFDKYNTINRSCSGGGGGGRGEGEEGERKAEKAVGGKARK